MHARHADSEQPRTAAGGRRLSRRQRSDLLDNSEPSGIEDDVAYVASSASSGPRSNASSGTDESWEQRRQPRVDMSGQVSTSAASTDPGGAYRLPRQGNGAQRRDDVPEPRDNGWDPEGDVQSAWGNGAQRRDDVPEPRDNGWGPEGGVQSAWRQLRQQQGSQAAQSAPQAGSAEGVKPWWQVTLGASQSVDERLPAAALHLSTALLNTGAAVLQLQHSVKTFGQCATSSEHLRACCCDLQIGRRGDQSQQQPQQPSTSAEQPLSDWAASPRPARDDWEWAAGPETGLQGAEPAGQSNGTQPQPESYALDEEEKDDAWVLDDTDPDITLLASQEVVSQTEGATCSIPACSMALLACKAPPIPLLPLQEVVSSI